MSSKTSIKGVRSDKFSKSLRVAYWRSIVSRARSSSPRPNDEREVARHRRHLVRRDEGRKQRRQLLPGDLHGIVLKDIRRLPDQLCGCAGTEFADRNGDFVPTTRERRRSLFRIRSPRSSLDLPMPASPITETRCG